jgi:hypothetical protein
MEKVRKGFLVALLAGAVIAQAGLAAAASFTNSTFASVDASSTTRTVSATGAGTVTDVNITIDFSKCDDPAPGPADTGCTVDGFSFNREIHFRLESPEGTQVELVVLNTYSGQTPGDRVVVGFDDEASTVVGGPVLLDGAFQPVGSLSDFDGENSEGTWTLLVEDTTGADPLQFYSFTLCINEAGECVVADARVPAPAALFLVGLGLTALGVIRRRI